MRRATAQIPRLTRRQTSALAALPRGPRLGHPAAPIQSRSFFSLFKRKPAASPPATAVRPAATLKPTDLFHPLSVSPFPALVDKANRIKSVSLCPTSFEKHNERLRPAYDCPDCGWPTHASQSRWEEGREEHAEYCGRLREVNEDEHDIRSGRPMNEFENMPEGQAYEAAINFFSWDTFFFTRQFPSIDSDRALRHVSKLLTYPISIAGVLHQNGPYTTSNSRITQEGRRSMAAIHSQLHLPPGSANEQTAVASTKPQTPFRIFLLGARAESTLPPHLWEQLTYLFPRTIFQIYFIGPEVGLPILDAKSPRRRGGYAFTEDAGWGVPSYSMNQNPMLGLTCLKASYEEVHHQLGPFDPYNDVFFAFSPGLGFPHQAGISPEPKAPAAAAAPEGEARAEAELEAEVVVDAGAGAGASPSQPLVQAQTTWRNSIRQILTTKCALFFTAFSPLDLERDVSALNGSNPPTPPSIREFPEYVNLPTRPIDRIEGVTDEFELVLTPGKNVFASEKWEIAEWDVRVGVKTNWGIWGIRGKKYEVTEGEE